VARPPNGASGTLPLLTLGRLSDDELARLLAATRKWERRNRMRARVCARAVGAVLFGRKPRAAVGFRWMAHNHQTESRPRWEMTFLAQAQVAAWSVGRAERERADGPVSVSGRMVACHVERGLRVSGPWAIFGFGLLRGLARGVQSARAGRGLFSFSSNLSQFIFCSEII
jgi:hypothetical protein